VKPTVYVETSIISYLVGWLNRNDLQVAAHQELTRRWWANRRSDFELFASTVVFDEASDGDPDLAGERLRFLKDVTLLRVPDHAHKLKRELLRRTQIPAKAENDALHIAVAAVHGMEFLATWNCKHIANAVTLPLVYDVCRAEGYEPPLVCTPHEILGENDDEEI
jgi:PIN domain